MACNMCSESSPRISFSDDLSQEDDTQIGLESRRDRSLLDSNSEFEFIICSNTDHQPSLADELFMNGMILPLQIPNHRLKTRKPQQKSSLLPPLPLPTNDNPTKDERVREAMFIKPDKLKEKPVQSKSFWGFKRSNSLNCDIKKSPIFSLPLLSRSNSTGSVPNPKQTITRDSQRLSLNKQSSLLSSSSSTFLGSNYVYSFPQHKPPLMKNYDGHYKNGGVLRVSPVLNVPPPCISKGTSNLFGFGSFLRNAKEKKSRNLL